ncbi:MAG: MarR family transcriptional regulator [Dehalococcoidales bacterium]|nr:MarR family transcriptional regulator [Dehalococcoidales bacterium]
MLTNEGRARFRRMKLSVDIAERPDGYKILDYIYEHGADTIEEIGVSTGLSREQVVSQLQGYMSHGLVEELD